jgi:hypothetical protein
VPGKKGTHLLRTGLDFAALAPLAAGLRIEIGPDVMGGIKLLEGESVGHFEGRLKRALNGP